MSATSPWSPLSHTPSRKPFRMVNPAPPAGGGVGLRRELGEGQSKTLQPRSPQSRSGQWRATHVCWVRPESAPPAPPAPPRHGTGAFPGWCAQLSLTPVAVGQGQGHPSSLCPVHQARRCVCGGKRGWVEGSRDSPVWNPVSSGYGGLELLGLQGPRGEGLGGDSWEQRPGQGWVTLWTAGLLALGTG